MAALIGRTVIVGDVHGCRQELETLLDRVAFTSGDRLVFVGDLVAKGPDSLGVLDIARRTGAIVVRGNHEQKLIEWRQSGPGLRRAPSAPPARGAPPLLAPPVPTIPKLHRDVARTLRPVDWTILENSPFHVEFPEHALVVVHAGIVPGVPLEHQRPETMMRIRTVRASSARALGLTPRGKALSPEFAPHGSGGGHLLWGACWQGPPHVVFGHNAAPGIQIHPWATGLDSGCVYGGRLTALVLAPRQRVPQSERARRALLISVPARRMWWAPDSPGQGGASSPRRGP